MIRSVEVATPSKAAAGIALGEETGVSTAGFENKPNSRGIIITWIVIRTGLAIGLVYCIYLAGKQGVSAWYLRQSSASAVERAIEWDGTNPQNFDDLGTLSHMYADGGNPEEIVRAYKTATVLSPRNASYWADLGAAYDWAGRRSEALAAFHRALQLFPNSPDINWRVANFYVRAGQADQGLQCLRKALAGTSVPRKDVFALAARATGDNEKMLAEVLPVDRSILVEYLNFRIQRDDIESARQVWHRILETNLGFGIHDALPYFDALIRHQQLSEVNELWIVLSKRFPSETHAGGADNNLMVNGGFEDEILNGGWDWRIALAKGASVSLDTDTHRDGGRSLRIDFDASENLDYGHVFQYVPVKAGSRYHFSGYMRVEGITTESGPLFEVYDAYNPGKLFLSTEGLVGTSDWSRREIDFTTNPNTSLLIVRMARKPSRKLAKQIGGTVWVDRVSLEAVP
jgi:tetratricopeptide repeat protein